MIMPGNSEIKNFRIRVEGCGIDCVDKERGDERVDVGSLGRCYC